MAQWGKTDDANSAPVYLPDSEANNVFFVDVEEAAVAENREKGLKTPGWNIYEERTVSDGSGGTVTRRRVEPLVPMKVAAADAGDLGPTGNTTVEDTTVADS
jgi:hypothetical protein